LLACLRVFERDDADVRQHFLALILNADRDEVVATAADGERFGKIGRLKIGNKKDDGATRHDLI